jgi:hypothetical protein
MTILNCITL